MGKITSNVGGERGRTSEENDVQKLGKLLQVAGLTLLPLGIYLELSGNLGRGRGVSELLVLMVVGAIVFYIGRLVEGYASR